MTKLAVTGHRPERLGGKQNFDAIRQHMLNFLQKQENPHLISGGALGIDQLWIEAGLSLKLPITVALPFDGYNTKWPHATKDFYQKLLDECQEVLYVSDEGYAGWKYQKRNEWMVDKCDLLVAYWDGQKEGGTWNCLKYALRKNKTIIEFNISEEF